MPNIRQKPGSWSLACQTRTGLLHSVSFHPRRKPSRRPEPAIEFRACNKRGCTPHEADLARTRNRGPQRKCTLGEVGVGYCLAPRLHGRMDRFTQLTAWFLEPIVLALIRINNAHGVPIHDSIAIVVQCLRHVRFRPVTQVDTNDAFPQKMGCSLSQFTQGRVCVIGPMRATTVDAHLIFFRRRRLIVASFTRPCCTCRSLAGIMRTNELRTT